MKCIICKNTIETIFLNKILGTYIKDQKGKRQVVCFECQKKFSSKSDMMAQIK
ncbi:MAG: hypothetical protein NDI94_04795 [Candidatus Woesearchaeota archaeon]|nr:hypothetical protein [Candidatus Woesearchaeota archaeon]